MHEMSLVQGLMTQITHLAKEHGKSQVIKVTMEIGQLSGVVVDSFRFGFEVLSALDPCTKGAELVVVEPGVRYRCPACGNQMEGAGHRPARCSQCGSGQLMPEGGDELILRQVELE